MLRQIKTMLDSIRWADADIERCLGEYLTEPRAGVVFPRARRISAQAFGRKLSAFGVRLALPTRMLTSGVQVFINSETTIAPSAARQVFGRLADDRRLPPGMRISAATRAMLYEWYCAGYIEACD